MHQTRVDLMLLSRKTNCVSRRALEKMAVPQSFIFKNYAVQPIAMQNKTCEINEWIFPSWTFTIVSDV